MTATIYLIEELSDARMRCDQLLRYIEKASLLIEKSSHKDHFFEVAGDVIRGIPETVFKLHKALEAVALAANRIDYEEIKQDLRPEKVDELERVLKDVRVRQVQRRSLPMVNPANVVKQLKDLAASARKEGRLDTDRLGGLIAGLEGGASKLADDSGPKVAAQLEAMVYALENPPTSDERPSRLRLAQALRKTFAEHVRLTDPSSRAAGSRAPDVIFKRMKGAVDKMLEARIAIRDLREDLDGINSDATGTVFTNNYRNTEIEKVSKELYELDNTIGSAFRGVERLERTMQQTMIPRTASEDEKLSRFEEGKPADPTKDMSKEDAKEWKENTEEYGDKFKKEAAALSEEALANLNTAILGLRQISRSPSNPKRQLVNVVDSLANLALHLGQEGQVIRTLQMAAKSIRSSFSVHDMAEYEKTVNAARQENDRVATLDVQPRDPKELSGVVEQLLTDSRLVHNFASQGNYKKMFFNVMKVISDVHVITNVFDIQGTGFLERVIKNLMPYAGARPSSNFASEEEKRSRFEEGKSADPTKHMDEDDAKAWKENTEEYGDKFKKEAAGEAAPAVAANLPMMNRLIYTCEEATKQFKHSVGLIKQDARRYAFQADNIALQLNELESLVRAVRRRIFDGKTASVKQADGRMIPPPPGNVIEEIMSWHGGQGSKLYSVGSRWYGGHPVDADDAEEAFDELEGHKADHEALADFEEHLKENGVTPESVKNRFEQMRKRELAEMKKLLTMAGFDSKDAQKLQTEGMGPEELKTRLKVPAGARGSLEYTHNLKRKTKKASETASWKAE